MKLRIISGELKRRYVTVGDNIRYRPTQERVRESVAEIVKRRVNGAVVADLCAGSGMFGFEMISRGAERVDFVEIDKVSSIKIADSAKKLGIDGKIRVIRDDVRKFAQNSVHKYDIVYYDPPYDDAELNELVPALLPLIKDDGLLMYERRRHRHEKKAADTSGKANIADARMFSDTVVEFYRVDINNNADINNNEETA